MADICTICERTALHSDSRKDYGICQGCVETLGLAPMPPARRPPVPCLRCNKLRFVRAVPRVRGMVQSSRQTSLQYGLTVNRLTFRLRGTERLVGTGRDVDVPVADDGMGTLEAYVCTSCGYVEWYCWDPDAIKIGPEYMTDFVDYEADAPYR